MKPRLLFALLAVASGLSYGLAQAAGLTDAEEDAIVAFLKALSDGYVP